MMHEAEALKEGWGRKRNGKKSTVWTFEPRFFHVGHVHVFLVTGQLGTYQSSNHPKACLIPYFNSSSMDDQLDHSIHGDLFLLCNVHPNDRIRVVLSADFFASAPPEV